MGPMHSTYPPSESTINRIKKLRDLVNENRDSRIWYVTIRFNAL
jgi:hypothetical protein